MLPETIKVEYVKPPLAVKKGQIIGMSTGMGIPFTYYTGKV